MRRASIRSAIGFCVVAVAALSLGIEAQAGETARPFAVVEVAGGAITFRSASGEAMALTVVGEDYRSRRFLGRGEVPAFAPVDRDGYTLPDGVYKWELVANPDLPAELASGSGTPANGRRTFQVAAVEGRRGSGAFSISDGRVVDSSLIEAPADWPKLQAAKSDSIDAAARFDDSDAAAPDGR